MLPPTITMRPRALKTKKIFGYPVDVANPSS
jgi:hypothetical protein